MCKKKICFVVVPVIFAIIFFVVQACRESGTTYVPHTEQLKPIWNLEITSDDIPSEKDYKATYRVVFENSEWKKDDPDNVHMLGTVELDTGNNSQTVQMKQVNLNYSYLIKNENSYKSFSYVQYDWVLKGLSEIENDGVYLSKWVPVKIISFPFKLGSTWSSGNIPSIWGVETKYKFNTEYVYTAVAEEEITVPAGTFKCIKVEVKKTTDDAPPEQALTWDRIFTSKWYSKGVGLVKSIVRDENVNRTTVSELVSIERGPDVTDNLTPALTSIEKEDIPMLPGQVALWQVADNVFEGTCLHDENTLEHFNGIWEGQPANFQLLHTDGNLTVRGNPTPLIETGIVYDYPLTPGKTWQTGTGSIRKVIGHEITTARLMTYLAMKIETWRENQFVSVEWVAPNVGPVRREVMIDGDLHTFELELFLEKTGQHAEYIFPWRLGETYGLSNPWGIGLSERGHKGTGRFAYDWGTPVGTPLVAARAGVVVAYREASNVGGNNNAYLGKENILIIRHDDGSLSHYAHLAYNSVIPKLGDHVEQGELIAKSGNTGWTTGPHLHFAVTRAGVSWPHAFRDDRGFHGLILFDHPCKRSAPAPGDP